MKPHHGVGRETHIPQIDSYHSNYLAFIHNCFFQFPIVTLPCHNLVNQLFKLINTRVASCSSLCVQFFTHYPPPESTIKSYNLTIMLQNPCGLCTARTSTETVCSTSPVSLLTYVLLRTLLHFSSFPFHTRCKKTKTFIISHVMCRHRKGNKLPILLQTLFNIFTEHICTGPAKALGAIVLPGLVSLKCLATPFLNL